MPLIAGSNHVNLVGKLGVVKTLWTKKEVLPNHSTATFYYVTHIRREKHQQEEKQQLNSHGEGESIDVISSWI